MSLLVYSHSEGGFIITADVNALDMLAIQTAACILQACKEYPTGENDYPSTGVGGILVERMTWAPHGFVNGLQSQVELLYQIVRAKVEMPGYSLLLSGAAKRKIVADALSAYQEWKTRVVEDDYRVHGPTAGKETEFNKKDWTDLNEKFLEPITQRAES